MRIESPVTARAPYTEFLSNRVPSGLIWPTMLHAIQAAEPLPLPPADNAENYAQHRFLVPLMIGQGRYARTD